MEQQFTQEQIDALIAAQRSKDKKTKPAATVMSGGKRRTSSVNAAAIVNAPKTSDYLDSLQDDGGRFDGDYEITIISCEVKDTDKGQLFATVFQIDSSTNDLVREGTKREHPIFWWGKAGPGETRALWEKFMESLGKELDEENAEEIYGEEQCMAGTRWALTVSTRPQKNNRNKTFTHHRYSSLD